MIGYGIRQLDCATFRETSESRILTESGGRIRQQTSTRQGVWRFRATPSDDAVSIEAWLDSLAVTRRSDEASISPDTDGLLGGRYRGVLTARGDYTSRTRPFVPDEVAEVAGMGGALDDFFPPLPARALKVGQTWSEVPGLTLRRLPDSTSRAGRLYRFELQRTGEARTAETAGDTVPLRLQQKSNEQGEFVWHPQRGLLRRERRIVVETTIPPSRTVRQAVRSKVEQRITLVRDLNFPGCQPGAGGR